MKHAWLCLSLVWILFHTFALAQSAATVSPDTLSLNNGRVVSGVYSNECLGFSLPIPAGWETDPKVASADGKASHMFGGGLTLLYLRQQANPSGLQNIHLIAVDAARRPHSAQDYVAKQMHDKATPLRLRDGTSIQKEVIGDISPVEYGGKRFFRAAFKQSMPNDTFYVGFVYTKFRGYFIGADFVARSLDEVNKTADSLRDISFRGDERDSRCVEDPINVAKIRVSEQVAQRMLVSRVEPNYPHQAQQARVEGSVLLKVLIGVNGDVEEVSAISGDPTLTPAAIDAVRQWKFKPFPINGEVPKMETQITVPFQLPGNDKSR